MPLKRKYDHILTKEFLEKEYLIDRKSCLQIGKDTGVDHKTVMEYIKLHGIPKQAPLYANRKKEKHPGWTGMGLISGSIYTNIRNSARIRNIPFNITLDYMWNLFLKQEKKCALTGQEIYFFDTKRYNASLDRKDSSRGYDEDNVWWIHSDVNFAKQSLSIDDFIELCEKVVEYNNRKREM